MIQRECHVVNKNAEHLYKDKKAEIEMDMMRINHSKGWLDNYLEYKG